MRLHCLLLLFPLLFLLTLSHLAAASNQDALGGWTPIQNINDAHVAEIADYAVTEYNKRSGSHLKLEKVIKGETQVVAGTNYRLVLAVKDRSATKDYEAIVWEKRWQHFRNLTSFKPFQG